MFKDVKYEIGGELNGIDTWECNIWHPWTAFQKHSICWVFQAFFCWNQLNHVYPHSICSALNSSVGNTISISSFITNQDDWGGRRQSQLGACLQHRHRCSGSTSSFLARWSWPQRTLIEKKLYSLLAWFCYFICELNWIWSYWAHLLTSLKYKNQTQNHTQTSDDHCPCVSSSCTSSQTFYRRNHISIYSFCLRSHSWEGAASIQLNKVILKQNSKGDMRWCSEASTLFHSKHRRTLPRSGVMVGHVLPQIFFWIRLVQTHWASANKTIFCNAK